MVIEGITYVLINVLWVLMGIAGPTPVAGTKGTTAAFCSQHAIVGAVGHSR